ncbi:MAG: hypothetical protein IJ153_02010 [Clostridia bacterium]|nr:hypothetical protein [Clostridia bacterium]
MKKIFALILALALVLTAVSAFAAGSKTNNDIATSTASTGSTGSTSAKEDASEADDEEITSDILDDNDATKALKEKLAAALEAGDVLSALPEDVRAEIPEGYTNVNEVVTYKLDKVPEGTTSLTLNFKFETLYAEGEKVIVAFVIPAEDEGEDEWILLEGIGQADGSVNVTLNEENIEKIVGKEVTVIVISK